MTDAEDRLRGWLRRRAAHAPHGQFMLERVRRESARRTRRRRVAAAGGLVLATALSVLGVVILTGWSTPAPPPLAGNTGVALVAGAPVRAAFPLRIPTGSGYSVSAVTVVAGRPTLVLTAVGLPSVTLTVTAGTSPPPANAKPIRLGADSAAMAWNGTQKSSGFTVWWTPPSLGWATIGAPPDYSLNLVEKVISGLRPGSTPGAEPFAFATVPDGFAVDNIDATRVTFCPAGVAPDPSDAGKIVVRWDRGPLTGPGQRVTVAGRAALLTATGVGTVLRIAEGADRTLTVRIPATIRLTRTDLLRFAAGIEPIM